MSVALIFWAAFFVVGSLDKPYFTGFIYKIASTFLFTLLFLIWWWSNRSLRRADKVIGFALIAGGAWLTSRFSHRSVNLIAMLFDGVPVVMTVIVLWLRISRDRSIPSIRLGMLALVGVTWSYFLFIRLDTPDASLHAKTHWRWSPTEEELFLAHAPQAQRAPAPGTTNDASVAASEMAPGAWTGFRGPERDGVVHGAKIATDWNAHPPIQLWKHSVGPAWSAITVIGDRLYTQEQRGEMETVVCYDAVTGSEIWIHEDNARFDEAVSGPGPRATPTFAGGKIFALGGTGILNCIDAFSGKLIWMRDIKVDSGAKPPLWGFASSPLVLDQNVIIYAGGELGKGLLAYQVASGSVVWSAPAGQNSYSSPQLSTIAGTAQCLMLHDGGLISVDPATGRQLWSAGVAMKGTPRSGQPRLIGESKLAVANLDAAGISMIEVARTGDQWRVTPVWESRDLKPEFPDFVVHEGNAYGFDLSMFACLDLSTGKRHWKEGRFGRGQVILLADQALLLVISETGEIVLMPADPQGEKILGRIQAIDGKSWNHPVIANGRLYVRNAVEMACFTLPPG